MLMVAAAAGVVGLLATAGPFAASVGGNVFASVLYDGCKHAAEKYEWLREDPTASSCNFDLAQLAGQAVSKVVQGTLKYYSKDKPGYAFLDSASRVDPEFFANVIDSPGFKEIKTDRLVEFLGAPHGGIDERAAHASIWYDLLVAGLKASNPTGDLSALTNATNQGLVAAAKALWEHFPKQFDGMLRDDPKRGGRAWVAFQAQAIKKSHELTERHYESHQELKAELLAFVRRTDSALASLAAAVGPNGSTPDPVLRTQIQETRNLAGSIYARVSIIADTVADIRTIVAGGPVLRPCDQPAPDPPGMLFAHRRIPFVCRDAEMDELRAFLASPQTVAWWVWYGAAGMGKSRLAHELCREFDHAASNKAGFWIAGFLDIRGNNDDAWLAWRPTRPTLIVVDYAAAKAPRIARWIADLASPPATLRPPITWALTCPCGFFCSTVTPSRTG